MKTTAVTNVSGEDRVIESLGVLVADGATVLVDADAAGRPPKGKPEDENYDPGEGLLAQPVNWAPGKKTEAVEAEEGDV